MTKQAVSIRVFRIRQGTVAYLVLLCIEAGLFIAGLSIASHFVTLTYIVSADMVFYYAQMALFILGYILVIKNEKSGFYIATIVSALRVVNIQMASGYFSFNVNVNVIPIIFMVFFIRAIKAQKDMPEMVDVTETIKTYRLAVSEAKRNNTFNASERRRKIVEGTFLMELIYYDGVQPPSLDE